MPKSTIGRLRVIGLFEGASFLLLLGIAMPLKYVFDMPMAVRIVGMAHGVLFIAYCGALGLAHREQAWGWGWTARLFAAAWFPFGPFVVDRRLAAMEAGGAGETNRES